MLAIVKTEIKKQSNKSLTLGEQIFVPLNLLSTKESSCFLSLLSLTIKVLECYKTDFSFKNVGMHSRCR